MKTHAHRDRDGGREKGDKVYVGQSPQYIII